MNDGGGGGEQPFFGFRSNFCAITRLKTLATQATVKQVDVFDLRKSLNRNSRKSWTPFDDLIDALGICLILGVQKETFNRWKAFTAHICNKFNKINMF